MSTSLNVVWQFGVSELKVISFKRRTFFILRVDHAVAILTYNLSHLIKVNVYGNMIGYAPNVLSNLLTKTLVIFVACDKRIDVVFAIDASGSIDEPDFQRILNFVRDFVGQLEVDSRKARVGFVVYSDYTKLVFHLNTYDTHQEMSRAIVDTKYLYGKTNAAGMFRYVRETMFTAAHGRRDDADSVLVVVTDGGSDDPTATIDEARKTRDDGIDVLSMGIGDSVRMFELEGMASHPKTRNVFMVEGYLYLFQATELMRSTICDGQLLFTHLLLLPLGPMRGVGWGGHIT